MQRTRRNSESGFAMLLVFLMAAVIAISLYVEIPRIAFDAQRQKEQLLIARGEQYKRAIEVFYKANKRYPATIEELDNMNNRHYLRHHYRDPITGKDEWRVIHTNGRMLTDSLVAPNPMQEQAAASQASPEWLEFPVRLVRLVERARRHPALAPVRIPVRAASSGATPALRRLRSVAPKAWSISEIANGPATIARLEWAMAAAPALPPIPINLRPIRTTPIRTIQTRTIQTRRARLPGSNLAQ